MYKLIRPSSKVRYIGGARARVRIKRGAIGTVEKVHPPHHAYGRYFTVAFGVGRGRGRHVMKAKFFTAVNGVGKKAKKKIA